MSIRQLGQTLLGIALAVTPVALWVAWTPALLAWVLMGSLLSAALLVMLTEASPKGGAQEGARAGIPDEFVEEVQRLFPMIYHHSGRRSARFHKTMQHLHRLMERSGRSVTPR
jgi:hypothetical protein